MSVYKIKNSNLTIYSADTFFQRLKGLLGRRELEQNEALHIRPCNHVHTIGMRYDLDIVFLDIEGNVLKVDSLGPNQWAFCRSAKTVLEFRSGCARLHGYDQLFRKCTRLATKDFVLKSISDRL